jgi:sigma-E factor negative regulatory protein RseA
MMEQNSDKVSLLVDGELDACDIPCVIQALKGDEAARARWENYHLIRDAMSGNLPKRVSTGLARRVAEAMEHEPVFINPRQQTPTPAVPFKTPSRTKATLGFALAASLSAIAVFGVGVMELNPAAPAPERMSMAAVQPPVQMPQMQVAEAQPAVPPSESAVQLVSTPAAAKAKQPLPTVLAASEGRAEPRAARRSSGVAVDEDAPVTTTDLYDYLVNYHRYAPGAADTQAMLSYVQLVGYGPGN